VAPFGFSCLMHKIDTDLRVDDRSNWFLELWNY
jgi:hypothetical protein